MVPAKYAQDLHAGFKALLATSPAQAAQWGAAPAAPVAALDLESVGMPANPYSAAGEPGDHVAWAQGAGAVFAAVETALAATPAAGVPAPDAGALLEKIRALPTIKAVEFDGEESDGTPKRWRNRPYVSLTQLERLLRTTAAGVPAAAPDALTQAARDVLAERARQVAQEGYDTEHDDSHVNDEIAALAALFVMPEAARDWDTSSTGYGRTLAEAMLPPDWNHPRLGDRRDQLVKGAAMAQAEIERIDRAAQASKGAAA